MTDLSEFAEFVDADGVKARVNGLVHMMLDEVEHQLRHGTPASKQQLLSRTLPAIMKELREEKEDEEIVQLRDQMAEQNEVVRRLLMSTPTTATEREHSPALPPSDDPS